MTGWQWRVTSKGKGDLGTFELGTGQGGGGPKSVTEFLHCRDTAGPLLRGGDVGPYEEDIVGPGRLPGQGCKEVKGETASPGEGWAMVLPVPGVSDEGGGDRADSDVDPSEAEHGRSIYCDATDSGPVRGGSKTAGGKGPNEMVGEDGDPLEGGQGKGGIKGRRSSGGGRAGVDGIVLEARGRHTGGDRVRHRGGGVPGSKRFHWSGVERGGGLTHWAGT